MGRLILAALFIGVCIAIVAIVLSFWDDMQKRHNRRTPSPFEPAKDTPMASTGVKKTAYVALIVVLFGVASGWLGGL
jgi:hypothetical protein